MASAGDRLRPLLAALDDATLAALASKGLVRRAAKDVAKGRVQSVEMGAGAVTARVEGHAVSLPAEGPSAASCDCAAAGCCRHVLALVIHLRESLPAVDVDAWSDSEADEGAASPSAAKDPGAGGPEADEVDPEAPPGAAISPNESLRALDLHRLAGQRALEAATRLLGEWPAPEVEDGTPIVVRFPSRGVECRILPHSEPRALVEGIVTTAPSTRAERFRLAAVLAWRRHHGLAPEVDDAALRRAVALRPAGGAPRRREEVVAAARRLLEEMLGGGLSHASEAQRQRLATLAVSAVGVHLPRLGLELRRAGEETGLLLARHAQAHEERLFLLVARTHALLRALECAGEAPPAELVGVHRGSYVDAGLLELVGVGAWRWHTKSGYRGLTLLFWHPAASSWLSWSERRPQAVDPSFSPASVYRDSIPWRGPAAASPETLGRSRVVLEKARVDPRMRLSSSAATRVLRVTTLDPQTLENALGLSDAEPSRRFRSWRALRLYAASIQPTGLVRPGETAPWVVVSGVKWGRRTFDEVHQRLGVELLDEEGERLLLELPWTELHRPAIAHLEAATHGVPPWGLVGRLLPRAGVPALRPHVVIRREKKELELVNLTLDDPPKPGPYAGRWLRHLLARFRPRSEPEAHSEESGDDPISPLAPATETALAALEATLLHLAEAGRGAVPRLSGTLGHHASELERLGLLDLASGAASLAAGTAPPTSPGAIPSRVLELRYLCSLLREVAAQERMS